MTTEKPTTNKVKTNWYKSAIIPWVIIATVIVSSLSFIAGWHMHQSHTQSFNSQVKAEATEMVQLKES